MLGCTMRNRIPPMFSPFAAIMLGPGRNREHQQYHKNSKESFHICLLQAIECKSSRVL